MSEQMLTEEQCAEFRRLPGTFNDMVRAIYEAGRASKAAEYADIRREARNAALEEAATYLETKRIITDNRVVCTRAEIEHDDYLLGHAAAIRALKDQP